MGSRTAFATLRRIVTTRPVKPVERCELCSAPLHEGHQHLLELSGRTVACACDGCALLFTRTNAGHYRRIPRRIVFLPDFRIEDGQWDSLMIPINLAYFYERASAGRFVALYPSPAGATESLLDLAAWSDIAANNPVLKGMEGDVEGLLVNRMNGANLHFLAPIDECFRLVGLIRTHWRGLSGGADAWREIDRFFAELTRRATRGSAHA